MRNKLFNIIKREDAIKVAVIIGILIIIYFVLQIFDKSAVIRVEQDKQAKEKRQAQYSETNKSNLTVLSTTTDNLNQKMEQDSNAIDTFFGYCNKGELEKAYDMLTDECKEMVFPNLDTFKTAYYDIVFKGKNRYYHIQSWGQAGTVYTYEVTVMDDYLSTGEVNDDVIVDYYTVVTRNKEKKLNIGKYISRTYIDKTATRKDITVTVNYVDKYIDYQIYNVSFANQNKGKLYVDKKDSTDTIYVEDSNNTKYYAYLYELPIERLEVGTDNTKTIEFKIDKLYTGSNNRRVEKIIFSNMATQISGEESQKLGISVDL